MITTVLAIDIGLVNFSFCVLRYDDAIDKYKVLEWKLMNILKEYGIGHVSSKKIIPSDLQNIVLHLFTKMFSKQRVQDLKINHIVIESQPRGRCSNTKMVIFAELILKHFLLMLHKQYKFGNCLQTASMLSAAQKYRPEVLQKYGYTKQRKYKDRKLLSVQLMEKLLVEFGLESAPKSKKTDDYADSFLLGYAAVKNWCTKK